MRPEGAAAICLVPSAEQAQAVHVVAGRLFEAQVCAALVEEKTPRLAETTASRLTPSAEEVREETKPARRAAAVQFVSELVEVAVNPILLPAANLFPFAEEAA